MSIPINTAIKWRTNGRGVTRVLKGTVTKLVKAGEVAPKNLRDILPHGDKASNRPRYIVDCGKLGMKWANCNTAVLGTEKLPEHKPRLSNNKPKAKAVAKVKAKVKAKPVVKAKAKPVAKVEAKVNPAPRADKPKTTWYGIVDGKIVSVRKVLCPEGFSTTKPEITAPAEPVATPAAAQAANDSLPQASV
jgi:hypothetical protein